MNDFQNPLESAQLAQLRVIKCYKSRSLDSVMVLNA